MLYFCITFCWYLLTFLQATYNLILNVRLYVNKVRVLNDSFEEKYPNFFRVVMDSSSDDLNGDLNKKRTAGDGVVTAGIDQNENTHKKTKLDNPSTGTGDEDVII